MKKLNCIDNIIWFSTWRALAAGGMTVGVCVKTHFSQRSSVVTFIRFLCAYVVSLPQHCVYLPTTNKSKMSICPHIPAAIHKEWSTRCNGHLNFYIFITNFRISD